jgi:hypothetical protein
VTGKGGNGPRDHRHAGDRAILLRPALLACRPRTSPCRNNERRNGHEMALVNGNKGMFINRLAPFLRKMLHCGKTNIARAANPPYCAQL